MPKTFALLTHPSFAYVIVAALVSVIASSHAFSTCSPVSVAVLVLRAMRVTVTVLFGLAIPIVKADERIQQVKFRLLQCLTPASFNGKCEVCLVVEGFQSGIFSLMLTVNVLLLRL